MLIPHKRSGPCSVSDFLHRSSCNQFVVLPLTKGLTWGGEGEDGGSTEYLFFVALTPDM